MKRSERQAHGFIFQNWVISRFLDIAYSADWDIPKKINPITGKNVSIKTTKFGRDVNLGDALKQFKIKEDFELLVAFYQQKNGKKKVVSMAKIDVPIKKWRRLWGNLKEKDIKKIDNSIRKQESRNLKGQKLNCFRQAIQNYKNQILKNYDGKITLNPKIDSKKQRRLQCTIPFRVLHDEFGIKKEIMDNYRLWGENIKLNSIPLQ